MSVLTRAIQSLHEFVDRKARDLRQVKVALDRLPTLNHRQLALLGHALGHPDSRYTPTSHANSHRVTRQTARTDLKKLAGEGLLHAVKQRNGFAYVPATDLAGRLEPQSRNRRGGS